MLNTNAANSHYGIWLLKEKNLNQQKEDISSLSH